MTKEEKGKEKGDQFGNAKAKESIIISKLPCSRATKADWPNVNYYMKVALSGRT